MRLDVRSRTHAGLVRQENEDAHLVLEDQGLMAVADGMGGHAHGEVASALAVRALQEAFATEGGDERLRTAWNRSRAGRAAETSWERFRLRTAVEDANLAIYHRASEDEALRSMGTTLVALYVHNGSAWVANVGDSRLYRLREGELTQLTDDHSLINEYIKLNLLSGEQARSFPMKNIIVRALGLAEWVEVDTFEIDLVPGDRYLLCSDGLSDLVEEATVAALLSEDDPDRAADRLVDAALAAGGLDNITVLLARVEVEG
ncbi:MAG: Stp1/IreP family PP2C-type Ser/Thr phosphatase [Deltaproteobacteria bacterium]|nr:Stp1/IreP family PP2C-type Ser/Thr phosphatase [Deltaproteobacteria bacterium]